MKTDEQVAALYQETRDAVWFELLHQRYVYHAERIAKRYVRKGTVDDVVQSIFLRVLEQIDKFDSDIPDPHAFRSWFTVVAKNLIKNKLTQYRRRRRLMNHSCDSVDKPRLTYDSHSFVIRLHRELLDAPSDDFIIPSIRAAFNEGYEHVMEAIRQLKPELRKVIEAIYIADRTWDDAAVALGIPNGTLKKRAHVALKTLRRRLEHLTIPASLERPRGGLNTSWDQALMTVV